MLGFSPMGAGPLGAASSQADSLTAVSSDLIIAYATLAQVSVDLVISYNVTEPTQTQSVSSDLVIAYSTLGRVSSDLVLSWLISGSSDAGAVDMSKVSAQRIVVFEASGSRLELNGMSAKPAYKVGDQWFVDRDPDEESFYAADITDELAARNTTAVPAALALVLVGVTELEPPVIEVASISGEQRTFVVAFLGGAEGEPPPGWAWTARVRCANGERFDKTTHFNRKDG